MLNCYSFFFFFQAEDGIRDADVTGVQTCALPISGHLPSHDPGGVPQGGPAVADGAGYRRAGAERECQLGIQGCQLSVSGIRSEERRVGKECRSWGSGEREKKKGRIYMRDSVAQGW